MGTLYTKMTTFYAGLQVVVTLGHHAFRSNGYTDGSNYIEYRTQPLRLTTYFFIAFNVPSRTKDVATQGSTQLSGQSTVYPKY